jgi:hypothetical protein
MEHHTDWVNDIVLCCGGKNCECSQIEERRNTDTEEIHFWTFL